MGRVAPKGSGGARGVEGVTNHVHDGVDILMHRPGPEPQGVETALAQGLVPDRIAVSLLSLEMVRTIDFNNQPPIEAYEVQNIVEERRLLAEMETFTAKEP